MGAILCCTDNNENEDDDTSYTRTYSVRKYQNVENIVNFCYLCGIHFGNGESYKDHLRNHVDLQVPSLYNVRPYPLFSIYFNTSNSADKTCLDVKNISTENWIVNNVILITPEYKIIKFFNHVERYHCDTDETLTIFASKSNFQLRGKYVIVIAYNCFANSDYDNLEEHVFECIGTGISERSEDSNRCTLTERDRAADPEYGNITTAPARQSRLRSKSRSKSKSKLNSTSCNKGIQSGSSANNNRSRSASRGQQKQNYKRSKSLGPIRSKPLLKEYPLPENILQRIKEIYNGNETIKDIVKALDKQYKLPVLDYFSKREFFLHLQECGQIISFEKLSQNEICLNNLTDNKFSINLTGIPNGDIELDSNVLAIFTDAENTEKKFEARVKDVTDNDIIFEYKNSATLPNIQSNKFNVRFFLDRYHLKLGYTALDLLKKTKWDTLLEPEINNIRFKIKAPLQSRLEFKLNINEEQERAINNILRGTSCSAPYIIYGGPGTGKTHTIIEAVYQILQCQPKAHVLISSISNKRCDEICKKLLGIISKELIFRYNSKFSERSEDLHDLSEIQLDVNEEKNKKNKTIYNYKVVIATLAACAKLPQMEISANHFTHVFIDDCNNATEIETLGAVAGIITSCNGIEGNLILAGDPKQFCPNIIGIKPHLCEDLGLLQSFIERLLNRELYKNDRDNIFKINLFKNYRSHPAILRVPNNQFYEGQLEVSATVEKQRAVIDMNIPFLPNPKVPIIFHTIGGKAERKPLSNSYFKLSEINLVMKYLDRLMKIPSIKMDEVGVITPYRIQAIKIEERCKMQKINVEVGTVAKFLGKEKRIIILSTVKVEFDGISFRKSGKIFNTAVTRAEDLLIVLGDDKELKVDTNWEKFIQYCKSNNVITNSLR